MGGYRGRKDALDERCLVVGWYNAVEKEVDRVSGVRSGGVWYAGVGRRVQWDAITVW